MRHFPCATMQNVLYYGCNTGCFTNTLSFTNNSFENFYLSDLPVQFYKINHVTITIFRIKLMSEKYIEIYI